MSRYNILRVFPAGVKHEKHSWQPTIASNYVACKGCNAIAQVEDEAKISGNSSNPARSS